MLLDIYERVEKENGPRDRRFRIEHAQHLASGRHPRFGTLGVIASMQPYHAIDDGRWAEQFIGDAHRDDLRVPLAARSRRRELAFGSDWFVAPPTPLEGIYAAVTRRTLDDKNPGGWVPAQKITVEEALRAYTATGALTRRSRNRAKGSCRTGASPTSSCSTATSSRSRRSRSATPRCHDDSSAARSSTGSRSPNGGTYTPAGHRPRLVGFADSRRQDEAAAQHDDSDGTTRIDARKSLRRGAADVRRDDVSDRRPLQRLADRAVPSDEPKGWRARCGVDAPASTRKSSAGRLDVLSDAGRAGRR